MRGSSSGGFDVTDLQTIERCVLTITHLKTIVPDTPDGRARFQHRMTAALVQLWVLMTTPPSIPENDLAEADRVAVCECAIAVAAARGFFEHGLLFGSLLLAPPSPPPNDTLARVAAPAVDPASSSDAADRLGSADGGSSASSIIIFGSTIDAILQCAVKSRANVVDGFTMALQMLDSMRTTTTLTMPTPTTTTATTPSRADSAASPPPRIQSAHLFAPSESTLTSLVRLVLHTVQSHGDPALPPVAASNSAAVVSWRARAQLRFRVEWDRRVAGRSLEPEATLTFLRIFRLTESPVRLAERIVQVLEYTQDRWIERERKEEGEQQKQQQQDEADEEEDEKELVRPTDLGVGMDSVLFVCREICAMNSASVAVPRDNDADAATAVTLARPSDVLARLTVECHRRDRLARALMHRRAVRMRLRSSSSSSSKTSLASTLAEAPTQVAHPLATVVANQRKPPSARVDRSQQQQRRQQETDRLLLLTVSTPQLDTLLEQARAKLQVAPTSPTIASPQSPPTVVARVETPVVVAAAATPAPAPVVVVAELPTTQAPLPAVDVASAAELATMKGATLEAAPLAPTLSPVSADAPSVASVAAVPIATIVAAPPAEPTIAPHTASTLIDAAPPTEPLPGKSTLLTDTTHSVGVAAGDLASATTDPTPVEATSLAAADPISPDAATTIGATSVPLATPLEAISTATPTATGDDDAYARAADRAAAAAEDAVGLADDAPGFPFMSSSSALSNLASSSTAESTFLTILARDYPLKDVGGSIDFHVLPPTAASHARVDPRVQARWKLLALRVKEFAQSWSLEFPSKPPPLSVLFAWAERVPTFRSAELILQLAEAHCQVSPSSTPHAADLYHLVLRLAPSVVSAESILSRMEAHEFVPTALTYRLLGMIYARHRAHGKLEALAQYMEEHGVQLTTDDYESLLQQACGLADEAAATATAQATSATSTPLPVDPSSSSTTAAQLVAFWVSHADAAAGVGWDSLSSATQASVSRVMDDTQGHRGGEEAEEARVNVSSPGFQCCMLDEGDQLDASLFGQVKMILRGAFGRGRTCERFVQCQTAAAARAASRSSRPTQAQARDE